MLGTSGSSVGGVLEIFAGEALAGGDDGGEEEEEDEGVREVHG
jgi:hypothetical protein